MSVGPGQLLLILLIVLLLFGAGRIGEIGKGLGEGIRNFKKGLSGDDADAAPPKEPPQLPAKARVDDSMAAGERSAPKDEGNKA